ncbi:MAG: divergent polysaccharide deacetylase family protein [Spirochaetia bacterium]|nr:divergent polysaccharide deacetylase family protein [Spirochaetota bacterium]MCX8096321.1 divergent polysaccharide deacetylase family protein [Spirochaetota bacterium]MDW8112318.1 divergent polysaccharide deacetylase family protein [Spirochaetia bacterium]
MGKSIVISVIIYIFAIVFVILGIPFISQIAYKSFSNEIYELHHEHMNDESSEVGENNEDYEKEVQEVFKSADDIVVDGVGKPIISIVIDDFGYSLDESVMYAIKNLPITVAVIPFLDYSRKVYEIAKDNGKEVIIHMPMESYNNRYNRNKNYIKVGMKEEEILSILENAFNEIPVYGMNNHMGSKATEDYEVMSIVLSFLKERGKFFLDSVTTPNTVGFKRARELGLVPLKRDVFIDNVSSKYYIMDRLQEVENIAKKKGFCIAIGHIRKNTIKALDIWYRSVSNKYRFVNLKDLYDLLEKEL